MRVTKCVLLRKCARAWLSAPRGRRLEEWGVQKRSGGVARPRAVASLDPECCVAASATNREVASHSRSHPRRMVQDAGCSTMMSVLRPVRCNRGRIAAFLAVGDHGAAVEVPERFVGQVLFSIHLRGVWAGARFIAFPEAGSL